MKRIKIKLVALVITFLTTVATGLLSLAGNVSAITSTMVLSPMYQKIVLIPGETRELSIKITNPNSSTADLKYSLSVGSFGQGLSKDDGDGVDITSVTAYNQIMDWIRLDQKSGSVKPNETDTISFTIVVPRDAPAGGQYATLVVRDETDRGNASSSNVNIEDQAQMASIIYAEVAGETINTGEILENTIPAFLFNNKLETNSLVKNTGNVHTDAEYTLQVWPLGSDEEICTNEEAQNTNLIMPGMERYYKQTCNLPIVGVFRVKQTVKIFGEVSTVEKTIVVCPLWLLFLTIFAIITILLWLLARAKSRKNSRKRIETE